MYFHVEHMFARSKFILLQTRYCNINTHIIREDIKFQLCAVADIRVNTHEKMCEQDGRDGDKSFFGLVRWQSVRVVPLDWLEDAHSLKRENLPIRCRCKWGPADQVVELMEISGELAGVGRTHEPLKH